MKSLTSYLTETHQFADELPFTLDELNLYLSVDTPHKKKTTLFNKIVDAYGQKAAHVFYQYMNNLPEEVTPQMLHDGLKKFPIDRIDKLLGAGEQGMTISIGDGKIIKVIFANKLPSDMLRLAANKNNVQILPKIYKTGRNWYIRDEYKINTKKCKTYYKYIDKIYDDIMHNNIPEHMTDDQKIMYDWAMRAKYEISLVMGSDNWGLGDWKLDNIGENNKGDIVYFDW